MDLRRLRYFCVVAEEMHITRAAARLGLAQPALTQQIRRLEAELGVKLLVRLGRGVMLTQAGEVFWPEAVAILERCHEAAFLAKQAQSGIVGHLSVGLTDTAWISPSVMRLLKRAQEEWPLVDFKLNQGRAADFLVSLIDGNDDVAFIRSPTQDEGALDWQLFAAESYMLAAPPDHPLASRPWVEPRDLDGQNMILPRGRTADSDRRSGLVFELARLGHPPHLVQRTPEYVSAINLVAAGFGVALVPEVLTGLRKDAVVYCPVRSKPALTTQLYVVSRRGDASPVLANFRALATAIHHPTLEPPA